MLFLITIIRLRRFYYGLAHEIPDGPAYFGLTPKKYQSGETDRDGSVSKVRDGMVRNAQFEAAHINPTPAVQRFMSGLLPLLRHQPGNAPILSVSWASRFK